MFDLFKKKSENDGFSVHYTDDIEHAHRLSQENPGASIVYNNPNSVPSPFLHTKLDDGSIIAKHNPDYIDYIKRQHPEMSDQEVSNYMQELYKAETGQEKAKTH